jgi:hypothetical protein
MDDFNNSDNSGMVGFLVGIIVLVFAGIVFSLMADKRFRFSSSKISLEEKITEEKHELETIKSQLETSRKHWRDHCEPLASQGSAAQSASADVKASAARLAGLRGEKGAAEAAVTAATANFDEYRNQYRQQVRAAAAGQQLAELRSRTGRVYKNVTIRKVTAAGIEIRHDEGNTRLLAEDLDASWHDRFQWTRDEVAKTLDDERARQERHNQFVEEARDDAATPPPPVKSTTSKPPNPGDEKLQVLREEVIEARNRYRSAQSEATRARIEAGSSGRGRSVPGALETWAERAARMETAAAKLRSQYMSARGKLAAVAPRDGLLIAEEP